MQSNSMEWEVWSHLFSTQMRWGSGTAGPQSHPLHCSSPHRAELSQLYGSTERWGRVVQTPSREARLYLGSSFSWDVKLCIAGCAAFSSDLSSWCFTDLCSCCITQSACAAMHPKCLQIKAFFFFFLQIIPVVESYYLILAVNWFGLGLSVEKYLEQTFFTPQ